MSTRPTHPSQASHPCARCGTPVGADQFLCAACRDERVGPGPARVAVQEAPASQVPAGQTWRGQPVPRGMVLPSRTQYHGTMYALIAVGVAVTLTLAALVNGGVGPFAATNVRSVQTANGPQVVATVRNQGEHSGRARCVATWTSAQGGLQQSGVVQTDLIQPGQSADVTIPLFALRTGPANVTIDCK
jgi:hypothetical protein